MGRSHYRSEPIFCATIHASANLVGAKAGAAQLTGFDKIQGDDMVTGTLTATHITVNSTGYIKMGSHQYVFFGSAANQAAVKLLRLLPEKVVENLSNCWKLFRAFLTTTYLVTENVNV